MDRIAPGTALYIKLGKKGAWERDCLERGTLRVGFRAVAHAICARGDWQTAADELGRRSPRTVTNRVKQLRSFYESGSDVLWVTFYGDRLWWCFSRPEVTEFPDRTKVRPASAGWRSTDILGQPLNTARLSGQLLRMQGFRGTICTVEALPYVVSKINGDESAEVQGSRQALRDLEQRLARLIPRLSWWDFEVLVDLIFRQAGWQRIGRVGGPQQTLDLDLIAPITGGRYVVQVKSEASVADFRKYQEEFANMQGLAGFYFVVHTPADSLADAAPPEVWLPATLAHHTLKSGLASWVLDKVDAM